MVPTDLPQQSTAIAAGSIIELQQLPAHSRNV